MSHAATADDPYAAMLRGALVPTLVAAAVCVAVSLREGTAGLVGSLLAVAVVIGSFSSSLLVMRRTARSNPNSVMAAALVTYTTKIGLLGLMLVLLQDAEWLSGTAFALTAMLCAAVWLGFEVRAYAKMRTFVFDQGGGQP